MASVKATAGWFRTPFVLGIALFAAASLATADMNLNSSEPGCNGSDPNVLMCDDFEDGVWYATAANQGGPGDPANDGWNGTIFFPIAPAGAARCGGLGAAGTNCTATHGVATGGGNGGNMADHNFVNGQGVNEIYIRFYTRPTAGYSFGEEKILTINKDSVGSGGIWFGWMTGVGGNFQWRTPINGQVTSQNQGNNIILQAPNWYYVEVHIILNSVGQNNGTLRIWINNCGTAGVCTGSPILRTARTDMQFRQSSNSEMIRALWWENWSQLAGGSRGERYLDQIKGSKVGPIGFAGGSTAGAPPASPMALTVQ